MKILIVYYSWTGNVARLAEDLRARLEPLGEVAMARIEPVGEHGYWAWLARSFLPGWRVPIRPVVLDLQPFDIVCLGFPKWTLSCPPVNQYIGSMNLSPGEKVGLFMSYGGFGQERYLKGMTLRIAKRGARIGAAVSIKRSEVREGSFETAMDRFCRDLAPGHVP